MPDQTYKKKKKNLQENATIGLKNVTIRLPEPGMR